MNKDLLIPFFIANKPFTVSEFASYYSFEPKRAALILASLTKQQSLLRIKRGLYLPVANKGLTPEETFSDPWIVIPHEFPNTIVSGWSAASFWGLTEQLFQKTILLQQNDVFKALKALGRHEYIVFKAHLDLTIGVESTIRENSEIPIADAHRTIVDMLENPKCGGGIQHTIDCFKIYLGEHYDEDTFLEYAAHIKNGVFFKRLGYLSEVLLGDKSTSLVKLAKSKITKGASPIDSHLKCEELINRWNLYISPEIVI